MCYTHGLPQLTWTPSAVPQQMSCAKTPSLPALQGRRNRGAQLAAQHPAKQVGGAGIPFMTPHVGSGSESRLPEPQFPRCPQSPLPVFTALTSTGAWEMDKLNSAHLGKAAAHPDPQCEEAARTCETQDSQEEPRFQLREPPHSQPGAGVEQTPLQQWAREACPESRRAVKTRSCWKNKRERQQGLTKMPVT